LADYKPIKQSINQSTSLFVIDFHNRFRSFCNLTKCSQLQAVVLWVMTKRSDAIGSGWCPVAGYGMMGVKPLLPLLESYMSSQITWLIALNCHVLSLNQSATVSVTYRYWKLLSQWEFCSWN